ncbi:MAG: GNAT family N-acetyltransferase [Chloroflexota bacterium]
MISQKRIEDASLRAWPAFEQTNYHGWILRFSKGYTKRANSVNPLRSSGLNSVEKITYCEKCFTEKGLPVVFRLTPFSSPDDLDDLLDARDYQLIDPTLVMTLDLQGTDFPPSDSTSFQDRDLDSWLADFCRLSGYDLAEHQIHRQILSLIPAKASFNVLYQNQRLVSCGLGVLDGDYFGLFDLVTRSQYRSRGFGKRLINGMLHNARAAGARFAYLQVTEVNQPALHLYRKLGFKVSYTYWYRVLDS